MSTARGGLAVLGAKVYFIVTGLLQQTLLPRVLGLAGYGAFSRVMAAANIVNNVVVASSLQGVSRAVAGAPGQEGRALRAALRVHAPLAVGVAGAFALASPFVAHFQRAPHIRVPLLVMAGVTLLYGLYAPLVGALNGRALFTKQAALDATAATLRTLLLVGLGALAVHLGHAGVLGAAVGAVGAAACVLPLAFVWNRKTLREDEGAGEGGGTLFHGAAYARVLVPVALAQLFTSAIMQADIVLLGRYAGASAALTLTPDAARVAADEWVGVYRTCQLFSFLPYQLLMSITQVLFPMVARAHARGERDAVGVYVARGVRLGLLFAGLFVAVVVALPGPLLTLAFGPVVAERGAAALRVQALGQGVFTLFGFATAILTSLGRERASALVSVLTLTLVSGACAFLVPSAPFGAEQLRATATATALALGGGVVIAAFLVTRAAGAFVPLSTVLRVAVALGVAVAVGTQLPAPSPIATPALAAVVGVVYVVILLALREVKGADVASLRGLLKR